MSIFDNDTSYNPLYLEDASGLDADFDEAVLMDSTDEIIADIRHKKDLKWGVEDDF